MPDSLRSAVDALYATFASYGPPAELDGCPCCVDPNESRDLLAVPLRALTAEQLGRYPAKAMSTWGDVSAYKHFLPRMLELAASDARLRAAGLAEHYLASKLDYARWKEWPADEQRAVEQFARTWWREVCATWPARWDPLDWLADFGEPVLADVPALLSAWGSCDNDAASFHLAEAMLDHWIEQGDFTKKASPRGWSGSLSGGAAIAEWFRSAERVSALERTLERATDREGVRLVGAVLDVYGAMGVRGGA